MGDIQINSQTIANIATTLSGLFIAYQAWVARKTYKVSNERAEKQKAIELAELYAKKILPESSYISLVLREIGVVDLLKNIKAKDLKEFDQHELKELLTEECLNQILKSIGDVDFKALRQYRHFYKDVSFDEYLSHRTMILSETILNSNPNLDEVAATGNTAPIHIDELSKTLGISEDFCAKQLTLSKYYEQTYKDDFIHLIGSVLNTLEYFCMYFNTGVADECVVYQSLHQSFLGDVKLLYFAIAIKNVNGKDKYYTNIIELYNNWSQRDSEQQEKEINSSRKNTFASTKIKK